MEVRASVSDLDALRYWRADEEADLARLIAQLRKQEPPTASMEIGTAQHAALEVAADGDFETLSANGYTFTFADDMAITIPETRELQAARVYDIDGVKLRVTGRVDSMFGTRVDDHKTTGQFDGERYMESYTWRLYLSIFDAKVFRYNVLTIRVDRRDESLIHVTGLHPVELYRYDTLEANVLNLMREFVAFARVHLPERFMSEAERYAWQEAQAAQAPEATAA